MFLEYSRNYSNLNKISTTVIRSTLNCKFNRRNFRFFHKTKKLLLYVAITDIRFFRVAITNNKRLIYQSQSEEVVLDVDVGAVRITASVVAL
jgi:hypothetical protein